MTFFKNKNFKTAIICTLVFIVWAGLSVYRTLGKNQDWFVPKEEIAGPEIIREDLTTTDEHEFNYAVAWCKTGDNWALINIDGLAEIVLDKNYVEVTDFANTGYAVVKDIYGNKAVIGRGGDTVLYDNCYKCDKIVSDDFKANMIIASKQIVEDGKEKTAYGVIDATLNWAKAPSTDNEYLKEFTKGIDGGVFTNEAGNKLYFYTIDAIVEDVDEFLFYDAQTAMFRKKDEICLIDKSGEHLRKDFGDVVKNGEWAEHSIYCEFKDGRKAFVDINGKTVVDLSFYDVQNLPRMIGGYSGILIKTDEGTKFTVIDEKGNFMFEPRIGTSCDTLTEKVFRVTYYDSTKEKDVIEVIDENGNLLFEVEKSVTNFNNGYAVKDEDNYVRTDGTNLQVFRYIEK